MSTRDENTYGDMNGQLDEYITETVSARMEAEAAQNAFDYASTFWVTKTGREIVIRQMEDEHLKNSFTMTQRRPKRFPKATKDALAAEMQRRGFAP